MGISKVKQEIKGSKGTKIVEKCLVPEKVRIDVKTNIHFLGCVSLALLFGNYNCESNSLMNC